MPADGTDYREDPALSKSFQQGETDRAGDPGKDRTIAARLFRRAKQQTMTISIPADDGDIEIVVRCPTHGELDALARLRAELVAGIKVEHGMTQEQILEVGRKWQATREQFAGMLADLCLDESLTKEVFLSPDLCMEDSYRVFDTILLETGRRINEIRSFRSPPSRA